MSYPRKTLTSRRKPVRNPPFGGCRHEIAGWAKRYLFDLRLLLKLSADVLRKSLFRPGTITILDIPADSGAFPTVPSVAIAPLARDLRQVRPGPAGETPGRPLP
jgi:hypothetical protein